MLSIFESNIKNLKNPDSNFNLFQISRICMTSYGQSLSIMKFDIISQSRADFFLIFMSPKTCHRLKKSLKSMIFSKIDVFFFIYIFVPFLYLPDFNFIYSKSKLSNSVIKFINTKMGSH
jgi:hypothetical protein